MWSAFFYKKGEERFISRVVTYIFFKDIKKWSLYQANYSISVYFLSPPSIAEWGGYSNRLPLSVRPSHFVYTITCTDVVGFQKCFACGLHLSLSWMSSYMDIFQEPVLWKILVFSSPDAKGHVSYCHHEVSVAHRRHLSSVILCHWLFTF